MTIRLRLLGTPSWDGSPIVGARLPRHVDGWAEAAGLALEDSELAEIDAAIAETGAGSDDPPLLPPHMRGTS